MKPGQVLKVQLQVTYHTTIMLLYHDKGGADDVCHYWLLKYSDTSSVSTFILAFAHTNITNMDAYPVIHFNNIHQATTVHFSSVKITQPGSGHGCMRGLWRRGEVCLMHKMVTMKQWFKLHVWSWQRGKDVWNEHFTACSYSMCCMCCTCNWESDVQIW